MFNLNPKNMQGMLRQLGMKQEDIDAEEVIIKCSDKNLFIRNPSVTKINFHGKDMFQISGDLSEQNSANEISVEDIKTVAEKAKVDEKKAREALEKAEGDIAEAIISLS